MKDMKEFYILGLPIETELGLVRFLKVREYPDYHGDLQIMSLNKDNLIYNLTMTNKAGSNTELINLIKNEANFFKTIVSIPELSLAYARVFERVFVEDDGIPKLTEDNFEFYRKLVLTMNCTKEEIVNPNPEIQRAIERSKRVKSQEGEPLHFSDIVTSVATSGISYAEINEYTIYQLYMTFHRIGQFKNYDTTTLFKTAFDKVDIDSWSKHIDLFAEEKHFVSQEQFKKSTGKVFDE